MIMTGLKKSPKGRWKQTASWTIKAKKDAKYGGRKLGSHHHCHLVTRGTPTL
jgi:hypothetical protein